jgi:hypothetical protein
MLKKISKRKEETKLSSGLHGITKLYVLIFTTALVDLNPKEISSESEDCIHLA